MNPDDLIGTIGNPDVCPLREVEVFVFARIRLDDHLLHLSEVALPYRFLLVDHVVVGLVEVLDELSVTYVEHADSRALWGVALEAELQALGTLERLENLATHVLAFIVGIPAGAPLLVVHANLLVDIDLGAVDQHVESQ